ncbi:hypothetical protein NP233_g12793 [Leucocoprinus birnbaumii]|uniref:Uncharacterized protein n=1 Tax=Leucocoprinus birnbaumii TaxID=56174 RepID=A0AAD5YMQ7_9AGAR|nr:hypothetical protein NP233_g12793 [Leucocoprinus birnbaumii]
MEKKSTAKNFRKEGFVIGDGLKATISEEHPDNFNITPPTSSTASESSEPQTNVYNEYEKDFIQNWPGGLHKDAFDRWAEMKEKGTHFLRYLNVSDQYGKRISVARWGDKLPGAIALVRFTFRHTAIKNKNNPTGTDVFSTEATAIRILIPPLQAAPPVTKSSPMKRGNDGSSPSKKKLKRRN